jgi:subtilisin-like proprotein convertase family protein
VSASVGLPATIPNNSSMTSTLSVGGSIGVITDINIKNLIGLHDRIGQLSFKLTSPLGTEVQLISNSCGNDADFNLNLDDQAASATLPCPYVGGLTYQPIGSLADFNDENANGTWTLTITDNSNPSSGTLTGWDLEVCTWENPLGIEENTINNFEIYPNPNSGVFTIEMNTSFESEVDIIVYDIRGRRVYNMHYESSSNFKKEISMDSVQSGLYFIEVNNGSKKIVKKIIIE